jgi:4'-phosphopantetheinyl transferase
VVQPDEIRVWVFDLTSLVRSDLCEDTLSADERRRASAYRRAELRRRFVAARWFLRHALAQCTGTAASDLVFDYTAMGKPFLPASDVTFNLSHCDDLAVLAIAHQRVLGIDLELIREGRDFSGLANRFFGRDEAARVREAPADRRAAIFYFHWTCKEAWIKAHGDGLAIPLDSFQVLPDRRSGALRVQAGEGWEPLHVETLAIAPRVAAALACAGPQPRVTIAHWS